MKEDDVEEFQVLFECLSTLYRAEQEEESRTITVECSKFLKKKMEELGTNVKHTPNIKTIQLQNIRTSNSIHLFAFNKSIDFLERFVDKRISMVLRLIYNSLSSNFEAISDLLADLIKTGKHSLN